MVTKALIRGGITDRAMAGWIRLAVGPDAPYIIGMAFLLALMPWLIGASMLAVVGVLFSGIVTMGRSGPDSQHKANMLMRWRVGTQLIAVLLVALYFLMLRAQ